MRFLYSLIAVDLEKERDKYVQLKEFLVLFFTSSNLKNKSEEKAKNDKGDIILYKEQKQAKNERCEHCKQKHCPSSKLIR